MIAQASIHESVLKMVSPGLPCAVNVDAIPGVEFHGKVQYVALLPDKGNCGRTRTSVSTAPRFRSTTRTRTCARG